MFIALFFLSLILEKFIDAYVVQILELIGINILFALSLNLINGQTGLFSLGHAGFIASGAYTSAYFMLALGPKLQNLFPGMQSNSVFEFSFFLLSLFASVGISALAGFLVGLPTLRLKGDYLAIVTLGFGEIIRVFIQNTKALGASTGLVSIPYHVSFLGIYFSVFLVFYFLISLKKSIHGRVLNAIAEDEIACQSLGINTARYKITAFVIGSSLAGFSGALFAHQSNYLLPDSFNFVKSVEIVVMVVLGGLGSLSGSMLSAILLTLMPEFLRGFEELRMILYALLLILLMILKPKGLLGNKEFFKTRSKSARSSA